MPADRRPPWYQRHPKKVMALVATAAFVITDLVAGLVAIPPSYDSFRLPHPYYHHGMRPMQTAVDEFKGVEYPVFTNSLGLRDATPHEVQLQPAGQRVVVVGDSFVESQGVEWEDSFIGMLSAGLAPAGVEVLNAGVVSYSPRLYYLKTRYLLEEAGLSFDHLVVLIDISDVQNEIIYQNFHPGRFPVLDAAVHRLDKTLRGRSLVYHTATMLRGLDSVNPYFDRVFRRSLADLDEHDLKTIRFSFDYQFLGTWTFDPRVYAVYGEKGLKLARQNMASLVEMCQSRGISVTIVVFPWRHQVLARDLDSMQVKIWRDFCQERSLTFVNLFPDFMDVDDPVAAANRFFIERDVHWNQAGHRLVATRLLSHLAHADKGDDS